MRTPYEVGDRLSILGCNPFVITAVFAVGDSWEYEAEYKGSAFMKYWKCDRYGHIMINKLEAA